MKRIFLTGASSGIGRAAAEALLAAGHEVWATSRKPETLPQRDRLHPVAMDLRRRSEVEQAFNKALTDANGFDVVINNAGSGHFGPAEFVSGDEILDLFQILVFAHVRVTQLALADMRPRGSGLIINVTSLAALLPVPFMAAYNAAKSAMASFTMSTQLELGKSSIRIVDLQPGDIFTHFNDVISKGPVHPDYQKQMTKTWEAADHNFRNAPKPEVVATEVLRIMSMTHPPPLVTVGDIFQTKIAPCIFRLLPQRIRVWGLKRYYGI